METLIFLIFAALALGSGVVVVTHRSPIYATLSLVLTLFSMAVLFVLLGAPFVGALQILVYAGAIVVLFLEPFYVASGFTMYLTRRAELEAWDIEQEFRRAFSR